MRRPVKIALWTAAAVPALVLLLVLAVLIVANTESGRGYIARLTAQLTDGKVELTGIGGSFPAALDLVQLNLRDADGVWLTAEHISLRWSPAALLVRHVLVDSLHIGRLHIERAPLPDEQKKPSSSSPSVPHSDLHDLRIDALELGASLAGEPVALTVHGSAHLRSLQDAAAHVLAQRVGGAGSYEVQLQFDPQRMDATIKLQEPAHGPLENLIKVPGLGELSVLARLSGPRAAERIDLTLNAGALSGQAHGTVNLVQSSADLDYALNAPEMTPYPGVSWQHVDLQGRFHGPFKTPTADGRLQIRQLQVPGDTRLEALDANLSANAGAARLRASLAGLVLPAPVARLFADEPLTLDATMRLDDKKRPLQLSAAHKLVSLKMDAVTAGELSAQATLRLPNLTPFAALAGQEIAGRADIKAQVSQSKKTLHLATDTNAVLDAGQAAWAGLVREGNTRLQLTGDLTDEQISVERVQLTSRFISAAATAKMLRTGTQELNARLELNLPELAQLSAALAGNLKLTSKVNGPLQSLTAITDVSSNLSVHGSPPGAVAATVRVQGLPKATRGTAEAHGTLDGAPLALNVSVEQLNSDTVHLLIHRSGWKSAHMEGDLTGSRDFASVRGTLQLRMQQLEDLNRLLATNLQGGVAASLSTNAGRVQLQLDAQNVSAGSLTASAQLMANGPMDALNTTLNAQSPAIGGEPATISANAVLNAKAQELRLEKTEVNYHGQTVHLLAPGRVSFANGVVLTNIKLGVQQAVLEANGRVTPALDLRASLREVRPELINAFVPKALASGVIQANAQLRGNLSTPTGEAHLDATGLRAASDAAQGLPGSDVHATAQLQSSYAQLTTDISTGTNSHLHLSGRAPLAAAGALDLKLAGTLDVALANPLLEAGGRHATGALNIDTSVKGSVSNPEIGGTVRLVKASLRDYTQGTNLTDINGLLSGDHSTLHIESLTARAAPGTVAIEGTIGILQPKIPVDLKLTAKQAQPIASNIITANVNTDIQIHGTAREHLDVQGTVHVNRANIEIPGGLPPNVAVLDVRRPGEAPPPPEEKPLVIGLDLKLDAPRQIIVKGRGLDAELGGEMHIRGTTADPVVSGGFELQRGFFTLASSKLTFSSGTVTFNGAGLSKRIDPTLDFVAQSQVLEITATVKITGLADAPKIELSSTPELPQDEILARLLFGEPASQLTALQLVQIGAALASLSGGGGGSSLNPVAKIQKALGLDRLSVSGGSSSGAAGGTQNTGPSIEAGRYVSSRVFVAVKESTTGQSQLAVDVDLTKHLKLQTRLGNGTASTQGTTPENDPGSSVGIAYQFEY